MNRGDVAVLLSAIVDDEWAALWEEEQQGAADILALAADDEEDAKLYDESEHEAKRTSVCRAMALKVLARHLDAAEAAS